MVRGPVRVIIAAVVWHSGAHGVQILDSQYVHFNTSTSPARRANGTTAGVANTSRSTVVHANSSSDDGPATLELPDVSAVQRKATTIFRNLTASISALEKRVAQVQQRGTEALMRQKSAYEQQLKQQHEEIRAIEHTVASLSKVNALLDAKNSKLRHTAELLTKQNQALVSEVSSIGTSISTALEFIGNTLHDEEVFENASELSVITELDHIDMEKAKADQHEEKLRQVAGGRISLLQTTRAKSASVLSQDLLRSMLSALDDLQVEQNTSEVTLKESFDAAFAKGVERKESLLLEQTKQNETKAQGEELHAKLVRAVTHLMETRKLLTSRVAALRAFATKVSKPGSATAAAKQHDENALNTTMKSVDGVDTKPVDTKTKSVTTSK